MQISLTDDQSSNLYSDEYDEYYHCRGGAYTKARDIFLKQTRFLDHPMPAETKRILEVGFGTGLNFFVTADAFLNTPMRLEYISLEKNLLPSSVVHDLHYQPFLQSPHIIDQYISYRKTLANQPEPGEYLLNEFDQITLKLRIGNALNSRIEEAYFDWVYLDAFSPDHNSELWTENFLEILYNSLLPGGGLSTYSVKGSVRRALTNVRFIVCKRPGIPGKREITLAKKPNG